MDLEQTLELIAGLLNSLPKNQTASDQILYIILKDNASMILRMETIVESLNEQGIITPGEDREGLIKSRKKAEEEATKQHDDLRIKLNRYLN